MKLTTESPKSIEDLKSNYIFKIYFPDLKYELKRLFNTKYDAYNYMNIILGIVKKISENIEDNKNIDVSDILIRYLAYKGYEMFDLKDWISNISLKSFINEFIINDIFIINTYKKS